MKEGKHDRDRQTGTEIEWTRLLGVYYTELNREAALLYTAEQKAEGGGYGLQLDQRDLSTRLCREAIFRT